MRTFLTETISKQTSMNISRHGTPNIGRYFMVCAELFFFKTFLRYMTKNIPI